MSREGPGFTARPTCRRRRLEPARASNCRRASVLPLRLSSALTRAGFDRRSLISTTRAAPRPRTRTEALAPKVVCGCVLPGVPVPAAAGGVDGVFEPPELDVVVGVVVGSSGAVTGGSGTDGSVVVTQPITGRHSSCGAAGTALVNVPAAMSPPAKMPAAPSRARPTERSVVRLGEAEGLIAGSVAVWTTTRLLSTGSSPPVRSSPRGVSAEGEDSPAETIET
jgi:hypothetical protein